MASTKPYSNPERWVSLYPLFINSKKTLEKGRRIPKEKAVEDPTAQEIYDILTHSGLKCVLQAKVMHPREPDREPASRGRVKVQLKNDDGSLVNPKYKSRKDLMLLAAELIPKLKSRQEGPSTSQPANSKQGGKKKKR